MAGGGEIVSGFMGGSAWSMTRDIADGFVSVTERTYRQMTAAQMGQLSHEIERRLRDLRGGATTNEASAEMQSRQRRIQRLNGALTIMRAFRQKVRR
jgi:hypothetical protein